MERRTEIEVTEYCEALQTWGAVSGRTEDVRALLRAGCAHLAGRFHGRVEIRALCGALQQWAEGEAPALVRPLGITIAKSCLLSRLIYAGEPLRTRPCPIHLGRWSGCFTLCPAGCNFGVNITGWLPNDLPDPVIPGRAPVSVEPPPPATGPPEPPPSSRRRRYERLATLLDGDRSLRREGTPDPRVDLLAGLVLQLCAEVEALRTAAIDDARARGEAPRDTAYGRAYVATAERRHSSAGISSGAEKLLGAFDLEPASAGLPETSRREALMLARLGYAPQEVEEILQALREAETYT